LLRIRNGGLYEKAYGHKSFETYCRERWNLSRSHAYELIDSARVVGNLSAIADKSETADCTEATTGRLRRTAKTDGG
jgi:hypothetical protein